MSVVFVVMLPVNDSLIGPKTVPVMCRVNSVSNAAVRGDSYTEGCLGQTGEYFHYVQLPSLAGPVNFPCPALDLHLIGDH